MGTLDMQLRRLGRPGAARLAHPRATRLLATLGAALMTVGLFVPVAARSITYQTNSNGDIAHSTDTWSFGVVINSVLAHVRDTTGMQGGFTLAEAGLEALAAAFVLGGLALLPLLWLARSRHWLIAARSLYAAWFALFIVLALSSLSGLSTFLTQQSVMLSPDFLVTIERAWLLPSVAVFPLGVLVGGVALAWLLHEPLPTATTAAARTPRGLGQWAGAILATWGLVVWLVGFYLMPQATTTTCPPVMFSVTQFAYGTCAGLDSDQVLSAYGAIYIQGGVTPFGLFGFYPLIVGAGCVMALGGWVRQLSLRALAWLAIWPIWAAAVALVALQGARVIERTGFALSADQAQANVPWHVAAGMVVTFVGIGVVVLGQVLLWGELVRQRRTSPPAPLP